MSPRERLQLDIAARLEADPYFADIDVTVVRPRAELGFVQIEQRADEALKCIRKKAGKGGAGVQVLMPLVDAESTDARGPLIQNAVVVRVQELPVHNMGPNGTQKSAEDIADNVVRLLHLFNPGKGNVVHGAPDLMTPSAEFEPRVTIDCRFLQKAAMGGTEKVQPVTLTAAGYEITLTTATSSATLYYSTDGSYPTTLYSAPFTVAPGTTIRAVGTKSGLDASNVRELTVT